MSGRVVVQREVLYELFIKAFDEFMASLAQHGEVAQRLQGSAVRREGIPPEAKEAMAAAQARFDRARDDLVAAREALGPLRINGEPKERPKAALWVPGRQ